MLLDGGAVRDPLLGLPPGDRDFVVVGSGELVEKLEALSAQLIAGGGQIVSPLAGG